MADPVAASAPASDGAPAATVTHVSESAGPPRPPGPPRHSVFGISSALVLTFGGVVLGALGGFLQAWTVTVADVRVPVGLILVWACLLACIRAVVHAFDARRAGLAFFVGWVIVSVLLALPGIGGDIVLGSQGTSIVYLFGGVVLGSAAANVPAQLRPRRDAA